MLAMIKDGVWSGLSAVIGICSDNFCSLLADTRRVVSSGSAVGSWLAYADDDTQKIFKLNQSVLYGMTGLYRTSQSILDAVASITDMNRASVDDVRDAVLSYLEENKKEMPPKRDYLVGGKMPDGSFRIYEIHMNFETYTPEVTVRAPLSRVMTGGKTTFGISCCLPIKAAEHRQFYLNKIEEAIHSSRTHREMLQKAAAVIGLISKCDDSVGQDVTALNVF